MPDVWFPNPVPNGSANGGNVAGSSITGWTGLSWVFEKLPDYICRVTISGILTLTTSGTPGIVGYNVYFIPTNFTQSVGGFPVFIMPAAPSVTLTLNPAYTAVPIEQIGTSQYFVQGTWSVGVAQGGGTGAINFFFSAASNSTTATGNSITLENVVLEYKTLNQSAI